MQRSILIIEDDKDIANLERMHLAELSHKTKIALDGVVGLAEVESKSYDLVILDINLPGIDGMEICRRIRAKTNSTRILMLSSKTNEIDRVLGLEMGADDYMTKPFSVMELKAKVKALCRRMADYDPNTETDTQKVITAGAMVIDALRRKVTLYDKEVELTAKEFDLLTYFAQRPGVVFNRDQLLNHVWGYSHIGYEHTVNSHINRLRAKIEVDPETPEFVLTVWGVGYKFTDQHTKKPH
jgi:DNA-binding response OmpR family regulator